MVGVGVFILYKFMNKPKKVVTSKPNTTPRDEEPIKDMDTTLGGGNTNVAPLDRSSLRDSSMVFAPSRPSRVFGTAKAASPFKQGTSTFNEYSGGGSTSGGNDDFAAYSDSGAKGGEEYI